MNSSAEAISPQGGGVTLQAVTYEECASFTARMQAAFAPAVQAAFGTSEPIPSADEVEQAFHTPGSAVYHLIHAGQCVGGAVVTIHSESGRGCLDLFFIDPGHHSRGLGLAAWQAIEAHYPSTRLWETVTPYFEQRNIHFYINKCGFRAVEFFNPHHRDPHHPAPADGSPQPPGLDAFFRFEKLIPTAQPLPPTPIQRS